MFWLSPWVWGSSKFCRVLRWLLRWVCCDEIHSVVYRFSELWGNLELLPRTSRLSCEPFPWDTWSKPFLSALLHDVLARMFQGFRWLGCTTWSISSNFFFWCWWAQQFEPRLPATNDGLHRYSCRSGPLLLPPSYPCRALRAAQIRGDLRPNYRSSSPLQPDFRPSEQWNLPGWLLSVCLKGLNSIRSSFLLLDSFRLLFPALLTWDGELRIV